MAKGEWELGVSISDIHFPFQDDKVLDEVLYFIKDHQPKYLVLNGDIMDAWEISKFDKTPGTSKAISDEVYEVHDFLKLIRKIVPAAQIIYIEGNHEFRMKSYVIRQSPALYGLKGFHNGEEMKLLNLEDILDLKFLNIEYVSGVEGSSKFGHTYWKLGDLYIGHYDRVNKHAGYTAKSLVEDLGVSVVQGHTHRIGMTAKTMFDRQLIGVEQGCLCNLKPNYVANPNWQHGFAVFWKKPNKPRFEVVPVVIPDYEFFFGNRSYDYEDAQRLYSEL